jgi:putative FmdB family regulatory protein
VPTYQYRCTECGEGLEVVQKFTDDPLADCPSCAGRLRKVYSSVGVVFKGSGFYRTDSRTAAPASAGVGDSAGTKSAKDSTGSTDSSSGSSSGSASTGSTSSNGSSHTKAGTSSAA